MDHGECDGCGGGSGADRRRASGSTAAGRYGWRPLGSPQEPTAVGRLLVVLSVLPLLVALGQACDIGHHNGKAASSTTTAWTTSGTGGTTTGTDTGGTGGVGGTGTGTSTSTGTGTGAGDCTGSGGGYCHCIAIDGNNDFVTADERFASTSSGYFGYYAWDESYFYVGAEGADIASADPARWVVVYLGGSPGTTTGATYGLGSVEIQPLLPFDARYQIQWRTDNGATLASEWSGTHWSFLGWDFSGDVYQNGTYLELRIPLADIGSPATLAVHLSMVNEANGGEWTWSGVPATSFADGVDPDYSSYYSFDLSGADVPASYSPQ